MNGPYYIISALAAVVILAFAMTFPSQKGEQFKANQSYQVEPPSVSEPTQVPQQSPQAPLENNGQSPTLLASPVINVWYEQALRFGHLGNPQTQVNILGKVSDSDGMVNSLRYQLNGGASVSLRIGPNGYRLANPGDFNIALNTSALNNGTNTLVITATDNSGSITNKTVNFTYIQGRIWPENYTISWGSTTAINDQAQVVDGLWQIVPGGVRPVEVGYDRLIAIGDMQWSHGYEITIPITVHSFHPDPDNPSDSGGVGMIIRWQGHQGSGTLPSDWTRLGAYTYYSNRRAGLTLRLDGSQLITKDFDFRLNRTYFFKTRVESLPQGGRYSFKVWEQGQPEPSWNSSAFTGLVNIVDDSGNDLDRGSMLLVAHRADATFGDVTISLIASETQDLDNKVFLPFIYR